MRFAVPPPRTLAAFALLLAASATAPLCAQQATQPTRPSAVVAPKSAKPQTPARKNFTLEQVVEGGRRGGGGGVNLSGSPSAPVRWLPDGKRFLQPPTRGGGGGRGVEIVDARTGKSEAAPGLDDITKAIAAVPGVRAEDAPGLARLLFGGVLAGTQRFHLLPLGRDFVVYDAREKKATKATNSPDVDKLNGQVSADGQSVAYVKRDNNLYVADVATARETQITADGSDAILNGKLDWVYEEELYGRGSNIGYRWSPDGRRIAFLRLDDAAIKPFAIVDQVPTGQAVETWRYPKAGDPNPVVSLWIVDLNKGERKARAIELTKYPADDRLIVRFGWTPNSKKVLFQVQPRNQRWLDMNVSADVTTQTVGTANYGALGATTLFREASEAWVEAGPEPRFLKDGTFLWESDRTGTRHIYRYKADGTPIGAVTDGGDINVTGILGVDEARGRIFFTATGDGGAARGWTGSDLYRATLSTSDKVASPLPPVRLTEKIGTHTIRLSPNFEMFVDTFTSHTTPGETHIRETEKGASIRLLGETKREEIAALGEYRLGTVKRVKVPMRDGLVLEGALLLPPDHDPKKRYPIFCAVYSGPASPTLRDGWNNLFANVEYQFMAQNGVIVWHFDNRSATERGAGVVRSLYRRFGAGELADIEDGLAFLVKSGYADAKRVAISGWSFGGYMTQYALTHSTLFKVGIAGAGVADWRLYDTIYTERYMDTPQNNPDGYKAASNIEAAANLSGKLLLIHGTMDDNVHLQNTMQFIYALQNSGKPFDLMVYPRSRHGVGGPQARHLKNLQLRYLLDNL